jgi:hypothetical protein
MFIFRNKSYDTSINPGALASLQARRGRLS